MPSRHADRPALAGDPRALRRRLGTPVPAGGGPTFESLGRARVVDLASLRAFLAGYREEVLVPIELPAIVRAYGHASRYEVRELIALDNTLAAEPRLAPFAAASQAVGRFQLRRLLPMRDQRLIRRYWHAVELGRAQAWHALVYGVFLSLYSLPLRQGLAGFARHTLGGFLDAASDRLRVSEGDRIAVDTEVLQALPAAVERVLSTAIPSECRPCPLPPPS